MTRCPRVAKAKSKVSESRVLRSFVDKNRHQLGAGTLLLVLAPRRERKII